jgi:hypothetical protein
LPASTLASQLTDEVLPPLKKRASTDNSTGLAVHLPALTLVSRLTDEVLPPLKKGASTVNYTGLAAHLPSSTLASQLNDEVLPPFKKGASTDSSAAHQATFPVSPFEMTSLLTNEVLAPLKEGVITHKSSGLSSVIVPTAFLVSIQQSTIPTFATTDATKQPTKCEDDSFIRDIPTNLICHVSKKGGMKSPVSKSPVSNHRDKFRIKRSTDHCCDGVSISSSGSHRLKRVPEYLSATKGLKEIPKTQN